MRGDRRLFIERLGRENQEFYGTPDGLGALRAFELTFEHHWTYVFELVQNALDAGARSIALRITEGHDALTFQHDGDCPLREKDIVGLSKVFRSTKGASTVGFMGIGFKSVFSRFREVRISGWGWAFRFEIEQVTGDRYGDKQSDLLGSVIPIWDDKITVPESGFTTRFEMLRCANAGAELESDLARFLPDNDRTPLAILASSGLERLEVDGQVWELGVSKEPDGSLEVTALSEGESQLWQLFPLWFEPSPEAIARFLEHRRIQPTEDQREQVYAEAARSRRVLGVLPLDDAGRPAPPARGRVYATLPTDLTLPFGLHVNADWLLNISRTGVREIEDNAWQREIVDRLADVLRCFLSWVAHTLLEPTAVQAAFNALARPTPERSVLEARLAEKGWRSRLRERLKNATVFPVWTEETGKLGFEKPSNAIVPPAPLAEAFAEEPDLHPSVLLKGPVLMGKLLGPDALGLLEWIGLFAEMPPTELERAWPDGLKRWWKTLADEQENRQRLLFRIWAAVATLASQDKWQYVDLSCIRTVTGKWLPVGDVVFLKEPLPSKREPGGPKTRVFIQPFVRDTIRVPDKWIATLRQGAARETKDRRQGTLSQAWEWIEDHARSIGLNEVVGEAITGLVSSTATGPDGVLISLGHWAKHRNRADLLIHVLVDSRDGSKGVPASEALLADPYVERGGDRRCLFPAERALSATYLEQDPKGADTREWRTFLEKTGVKGALEVRSLKKQATKWERKLVAEFLGLGIVEIGESNNSGYELLDFDIEPSLPDQDASKELRMALASWLEDGRSALRGKGRRQSSYFYYTPKRDEGNTPSIWATKLSELAWVPCNDGELRPPRNVLSQTDAAREDVPVATLSPDLLSILEQEGVTFGSAIPEATPLYKLTTIGGRLDTEALAQLLRECREWITTDQNRNRFEQALRELPVPTSDGERIPLDRIVHRVRGGGSNLDQRVEETQDRGRLRGALGGWIVPLGQIDEILRIELEHSDLPYAFPDTTTGNQALAYLRSVWARARSSPKRLAIEVRDVLPAAYNYCLDDLDKDASLSADWEAVVPEAAVFADREWIIQAKDDVYFDDIEDRRFLPSQVRLLIATGGHFGNTRSAQLRTAEAIGLPLLSSVVTMEWHGEDDTLPVDDDWSSRLNLICDLLRWVREGRERTDSDGTGTGTKMRSQLEYVHELVLEVSVGEMRSERVPVNARLHEGILTVAGTPVQFAADAAKELLRNMSFGQRADLATDLTGMLGAINNEADFNLAVEKFKRSFARDFDFSARFSSESKKETSPDSKDESSSASGATESTTGREGGNAESTSEPLASGGPTTIGVNADVRGSSLSCESDSTDGRGSFIKSRALAQQEALAEKLRSSLKGEIEPDEDDTSKATTSDADSIVDLGDEVYRKVAVQYEQSCGRDPEIGDPHQRGWDIRSIDRKTQEVRLIEVKGKGRPWTDDEVVELSRAQVREAFEAFAEQTKISWYLYVVEKTDDSEYQVLPIANPVGVAAKWILCGSSWRMVAEDRKRISIPES